MDGHAFLENLALVLCVAGLTAIIAHRLRLPLVFGYLAAGMLVGPYLPFPLGADTKTIIALSELGVILLMFSLGLEFRLRRVKSVAADVGPSALAETTVMFGVGYAFGTLAGWTQFESLFLAAMLSISSTTIIARSFSDLGITGRLRELVFGILIIEDLVAILLIALLSAAAAQGSVTFEAAARTALRLAVFLALLTGLGMVLLPRTIQYVVRIGRREMVTIPAVAVAFASALLALKFGYSVALGAFIAGSLVAESGHGEFVEHRIESLRDVFLAIFFVSVGMLLDPRVLAAEWLTILLLCITVVAGKVLAVSLGVFAAGHGVRNAVRAGLSLGQIGEFSFILASLGLATGAIRPFLYPVAVAVSAITTLTTPLLITRAERVATWVDREMPRPLQMYAVLYSSWIERLRAPSPEGSAQGIVGRQVRLVLVELAGLVFVVVASGIEFPVVRDWIISTSTWSPRVAQVVVLGAVAAFALPLLTALTRSTRTLASLLAQRALPTPAKGLDRAAVPRAALIASLHFAIMLAASSPIFLCIQFFTPRVPAIAIFALLSLILGAALWNSTRNLYGHATAGADVFGMALQQHDRVSYPPAELTTTVERVSAMLPGLGNPTAAVLRADSPAAGQTLRGLDLRGRTGAMVLSITHADGHAVEGIPEGSTILAPGDVLVLAGTAEAVAAARGLLSPAGRITPVTPSHAVGPN